MPKRTVKRLTEDGEGRGLLFKMWMTVRRLAPLVIVSCLISRPAAGHDLDLQLDELRRGVERIYLTLNHYRASPPLPPPPESARDHRRILGAAEIELKLGRTDKALRMLVGRLVDEKFRALPEYVDTLLLTSQILEERGEVTWAMNLSRGALAVGGDPEQMAEAGARWFRLSRRHQHLEDRLEVYEQWKNAGGLQAAGVEVGAQAAYEAAFALRDEGRFSESQRLLSTVPSDTTYGSRAAYLAGTLFVQVGDLEHAEQWFAAIMDWPLPDLDEAHPQYRIERELRDLAALAAGRLRFERGDHNGARLAYGRIGDGSNVQNEACLELAYLSVERGKQKGALAHLRCVMDLGTGGQQRVDARLMRASLLAHLSQYDEAIETYNTLYAKFALEQKTIRATIAGIKDPTDYLFRSMERTAVVRGRHATPGPATVFEDAWTPEVDRAYRLDSDLTFAKSELRQLLDQVNRLVAIIERPNAFPSIDIRQEHLHGLLRDIQHLESHAGDTAISLGRSASDAHSEAHSDEASETARLISVLGHYRRAAEADLIRLDNEKRARKAEALSKLISIRTEVAAIARDAGTLHADASAVIDAAAVDALEMILASIDHATMRAEVGVLDTYWLAKEHISREIREQANLRDEIDAEYTHAAREFAR